MQIRYAQSLDTTNRSPLVSSSLKIYQTQHSAERPWLTTYDQIYIQTHIAGRIFAYISGRFITPEALNSTHIGVVSNALGLLLHKSNLLH